MATPDMDVIKEIAGYKVIMKAVLKSQIQQLVEQLAAHTDEESVILTASVSDGTLSHLGSDSGKNFLEDHEDIKSQFLGFCLKRHHRMKIQQEQEKAQAAAQAAAAARVPAWPAQLGPGPGPGPRHRFGNPNRPPGHMRQNSSFRHEPYQIPRPRRSLDSPAAGPVGNFKPVTDTNSFNVKVEPDDSSQQFRSDEGTRDTTGEQSDNSNQASDSTQDRTDTNTDFDSAVKVKVEAMADPDMDLEITGVELGSSVNPGSSQQDSPGVWSPNAALGLDPMGATGSPGDLQAQPAYSAGSSRDYRDLKLGTGNGTTHTLVMPPEKQHLGSNYKSNTTTKSIEIVLGTPFSETIHDVIYNIPTKSLECDICLKLFPTKWKLDTHYRIHTGEKPFSCKVCGRAFSVKGNLKSHMAVHMN